MIERSDVTVVLPCRNEAQSLPDVLDAVPDGYHRLVVDNGSTDGTADVARAHGAEVVVEAIPGYGSAVHAGITAARTTVVAVMDGDGSMDPRELPGLVAALDSAQLVVGRRRPVHRSGSPWHARLGNTAIAWRLRRRLKIDVHDIGALRVARRDDLLSLDVPDRRSGYPLQLLVLAARAGWTVVEHDISYRPRTGGVSKVSGSVRGTVVAVWDFAKVIP
ncbi:glycosyltransferase family 2 protein [Rhodococcus sp. UNC23MFCrub1.1]|uniref:glycosyltransferase family 2 protein n=1 Tax=Rhodococcus sp. UNC23MFCrub1.1 TaxID=1449068 RepID=UPI0004867151|nr:glycosyltransferase family 2 protein [Rhodococcus sp. UNC23MFCrub1.1]